MNYLLYVKYLITAMTCIMQAYGTYKVIMSYDNRNKKNIFQQKYRFGEETSFNTFTI